MLVKSSERDARQHRLPLRPAGVRRGLSRSRAASVMETPRAPLGELYGTTLERQAGERGVTLRTKTGIAAAVFEGGRFAGVRTREGEVVAGDHGVIAAPFHRVCDLLLTRSASVTLHSPICPNCRCHRLPACISGTGSTGDGGIPEHLVPVGRTIQWLFRRDGDDANLSATATTSSEPGNANVRSEYVQAVISVAGAGLDRPGIKYSNESTERCVKSFPERRRRVLIRSRVVTERRDVPSPGVTRGGRPNAREPRGFGWRGRLHPHRLAGNNGGAVRSGFLAEQLLANWADPKPSCSRRCQRVDDAVADPRLTARRKCRP